MYPLFFFLRSGEAEWRARLPFFVVRRAAFDDASVIGKKYMYRLGVSRGGGGGRGSVDGSIHRHVFVCLPTPDIFRHGKNCVQLPPPCVLLEQAGSRSCLCRRQMFSVSLRSRASLGRAYVKDDPPPARRHLSLSWSLHTPHSPAHSFPSSLKHPHTTVSRILFSSTSAGGTP